MGTPTNTRLNANADNRQVARNAALSYLTLGTQILSGLVVTPLLFRGLGENAFGTYSLLVSIVAYVGLLELGVGTATLRRVAVAATRGRSDEMGEVLGSSRALYARIIVITAVAFIPLVIWVPFLPGAGGAGVGEVRVVIASFAVGQLFGLIMNVYPAYIYGTGRADVLLGLGAGFSLLQSCVQVVVVLTGGGIVLLAVATTVVGVLNALAASRIAKRLLGGVRVRRQQATPGTKQHLFRFGLKNAAVAVLGTISSYTDVFVVGAFLSASHVAAYAVASRGANFAKSLATRAADVLVPTFADAAARDDESRQFKVFSEASLFATVVLIPSAVCVTFFGTDLLQVWLGTVPAGAPLVLSLLVIGATVQVVGHVGYVFFNGRGELGLFLGLGSVIATANLIASVVLTMAIGVAGPAIASLAAFSLFDLVVVPTAVARRLNRNPSEFYALLVRVFGPGLLVAIATAAITKEATTTAVGGTLAAVVTASAFALATMVSFGRSRRRAYVHLILRRDGQT